MRQRYRRVENQTPSFGFASNRDFAKGGNLHWLKSFPKLPDLEDVAIKLVYRKRTTKIRG